MEDKTIPWWKKAVVYQVYPRSFQDSDGDGIGDLRGIIRRLPYLEYLGVDALWICPVYASPNDDNGYDISDYRAIDPPFGTMEDMQELIDQAKARGIRILLDLVVNHTSDEHPWFAESRSSRDSPKRDWYIWKKGDGGAPPTEWGSFFGGSVWELDEATGEYYFHAFSRKQPDLNWENPEVRRAVYEMMNWWLDRGIAGFRVDAITIIKKNQAWPRRLDRNRLSFSVLDGACCNESGIMDFLREMRDEVLVPRGAVTVAEAPGVPLSQMEEYIGEGSGVFNMIFAFDHMDLDVSFDRPGEIVPWTRLQWKEKMAGWQRAVDGRGWLGLFLENHDHPRSVSRFGDPVSFRNESAKTLATWYFLMRGTPFVYQGQELGMVNAPFSSIADYRDIAALNLYRDSLSSGSGGGAAAALSYLARRGRDHARTPMPWDGSSNAGFSSGKPWIGPADDRPEVNVGAELGAEGSVLEHYRALIRLRREMDVFALGDFLELEAQSDRIGGYQRRLGKALATVWCNFTGEPVQLPVRPRGEILLDPTGRFDGMTLDAWQSVVTLSGKN